MCTPWPALGWVVDEMTVPVRLRARDRRPGAPSPTPGTTSALVRNTAEGAALGKVCELELLICPIGGRRLTAAGRVGIVLGFVYGFGGLRHRLVQLTGIKARVVERVAAPPVWQRELGGHPDVLLGDSVGPTPCRVRDRSSRDDQVGPHAVDVERRTQRSDAS